MTSLAFGLGTQELLIVGGLLVLLFGARKLPELARSMGTSITQFKKGLKEEDSDPELPPAGSGDDGDDEPPRRDPA
jgi:sec-independent protein translocase protein TatA